MLNNVFASPPQIIPEGDNIELKCRLDEEMEEGKGTVTWYFNDTVLEESSSVMLEFDGTFAKLFIAKWVANTKGLNFLMNGYYVLCCHWLAGNNSQYNPMVLNWLTAFYFHRSTMANMGAYKVKIENPKGSDETACKVTVKPVRPLNNRKCYGSIACKVFLDSSCWNLL